MKLLPKANKAAMIKLLKSIGQDVPNSRAAAFSSLGRSVWLRWHDSCGVYHVAYFAVSAGKPMLQIDNSWPAISLADAIRHGMVEEVREQKK